jgi:hypothetical protein
MNRTGSREVRQPISGWNPDGEGGDRAHSGLQLTSMPVAIRVDTALPMGTRGSLPASKLIWVSPRTENIPAKALGVVLLPN